MVDVLLTPEQREKVGGGVGRGGDWKKQKGKEKCTLDCGQILGFARRFLLFWWLKKVMLWLKCRSVSDTAQIESAVLIMEECFYGPLRGIEGFLFSAPCYFPISD